MQTKTLTAPIGITDLNEWGDYSLLKMVAKRDNADSKTAITWLLSGAKHGQQDKLLTDDEAGSALRSFFMQHATAEDNAHSR